VGPPTDRQALINFYRKVHPFGPGWRAVQREAGVSDAEAAGWAQHENIPLALLGWLAGCIMIWSALFTVGNFLYGRMGYAGALLAVFLLSAVSLQRITNRLWR
jgi:hypothetical protein